MPTQPAEGLLQFTQQQMMDTPPEALVNVTDSPEVRVFLSNLPQEKYIPGPTDKSNSMIHFDDGGFHQESSRLTNNAFELKGVGINRWEPLFFDPQKNSIEPFRRLGEDTVLHTLDQHVDECGNV